jgi:predicted NBD/HSP70 family sugar kinase
MVLIPSKMGRINKRALLWRLQRVGLASRADLAKSLGLSQPTVGKIADELLRLGVVEEIEAGPGTLRAGLHGSAGSKKKVGRPGRLMRLNSRCARFLAIQLGVSDTRLAALPVGTDAEDRWDVQVKTPDSAEAWGRQLKQAAEKIPQKDFWGILVSVPGIVDEAAARILFSPNLHWTETADLPSLIQNVWPAPVVLVQEERALALGQQHVDQNKEDFLLVDFGEGVGGAAILGGKLYTSTLPLHGELGHTPVLGNSRVCGCGAVGCLETLVSVRGLIRDFAPDSEDVDQAWKDLADAITRQGIPSWLAPVLDSTAVVIAGALNVMGLRRVVITGAFKELPPVILDYLARQVIKGAMWARFGEVKVDMAARHRTAGLVAVGIDRLVLPMQKEEGEADGGSDALDVYHAFGS